MRGAGGTTGAGVLGAAAEDGWEVGMAIGMVFEERFAGMTGDCKSKDEKKDMKDELQLSRVVSHRLSSLPLSYTSG